MANEERRVDAILFDMVGVLLFPKPQEAHDPRADEIELRLNELQADAQSREAVSAEYGLDPAGFQTVMETIVAQYEAFAPLWALLPRLQARYRLAVINNGNRWTIPTFRRVFPFDQHVDLFVNSAILGAKKPDPRIYLYACGELSVPPERCLFMDDSERNVQGAQEVGMHGIWWRSRHQGFGTFLDFIAADLAAGEDT